MADLLLYGYPADYIDIFTTILQENSPLLGKYGVNVS
jgi:hypothetical protein